MAAPYDEKPDDEKPDDDRHEDETARLDDLAQDSPEDEQVASLVAHTIDVPVLASAVERQEAADAADTLEDLEDEAAADVLEQMDDAVAAGALAEMQTPLAAGVLEDLVEEGKAPYAGALVRIMAPDDAADLLQGIDEPLREDVLAAMPLGDAIKLRRLMAYHGESAGGLMTTDYMALGRDMSIAEATDLVRSRSIPEGVQYMPVVDADGILIGIVGLRSLLISRHDEHVGDVMKESVKVVRPNLDRERVAQEFDRYDYSMLPVVDDRDRLLGIVTVDDVIDIIRAEQTEDVHKTVGAGAGEAVYSGLPEKFRGRFPWLGVSLVMTCLAAGVVLVFEDLIRDMPILAFLMPVLAALVGNAGHQALAVTLRGIVLDEVRRDRVGPLILRELALGLVNGAILGAVMLVGLGVFASEVRLGLVVAGATTLAMGVGTLCGSAIPLIMRRIGVDPAQASAIFLIMITDALSFTFLLGLTFFALSTTAP